MKVVNSSVGGDGRAERARLMVSRGWQWSTGKMEERVTKQAYPADLHFKFIWRSFWYGGPVHGIILMDDA